MKWFNEAKDYGFISRQSGEDVFVHFSAVQVNGLRTLQEGQAVEFSVTKGPNGFQAENAQPILRKHKNTKLQGARIRCRGSVSSKKIILTEVCTKSLRSRQAQTQDLANSTVCFARKVSFQSPSAADHPALAVQLHTSSPPILPLAKRNETTTRSPHNQSQ